MSASETVRVRIAPSPTGYFHVGTARTAIYNFLLARRQGGAFLLRIEDTDLERSESEYVDVILDGLRWLGVTWDEEPVYQSTRQDLYAPHIASLVQSGGAYPCYCTPEELRAEREDARARKLDWKYSGRCRNLSAEERARRDREGVPAAIRLAVPESGETNFDDLIAGRLTRQNADIEDFVIARSDGRALYNFAVVVDDHLMGITHVVRGNDHINNTFKQVWIYDALGWDRPAFAHAPLILRPDKSKVSKRKGDPSVTDYRDRGYLPDALFNYLCLLGWSPGDDREILPRNQLIEAFSLTDVSAANPILDPVKLEWMNGDYIRRLELPELARLVEPFVIGAGLATAEELETRRIWFEQAVGQLQERCKTLAEFARAGKFYFVAPETYNAQGIRKHFSQPEVTERLRRVIKAWNNLEPFESDNLETALRALARDEGEKLAVFIHPTRLALTGATAGPGLFQLAGLLGADEVCTRLERAVTRLETGALQPAQAEEST